MTSLKDFMASRMEQKVDAAEEPPAPKLSPRGIPMHSKKSQPAKEARNVLTSPLRSPRGFTPQVALEERKQEQRRSNVRQNGGAAADEDATVQQGSLRIPSSYLSGAKEAGLGGANGMYNHVPGVMVGGGGTSGRGGNGSWDQQSFRDTVERDIMQQSLGVSFDDVVALRNAKRLLNEAVVLPFIIPEFFSGVRKPWKGVLLFGPPGTGKTMLAKAICGMNNLTFFNCSAATLVNKYWGESEKIARALFTVARERAPSVIFFDEVDAIMSSRSSRGEAGDESSRRLKTEILKQVDAKARQSRQARIQNDSFDSTTFVFYARSDGWH